MYGFESVRVTSSFCPAHQTIPDRVGQRVLRGVLFMDSRTRFVISHVTYLTWLEGGHQIDPHGLAAIPAPRPFATQRSAGHWSRCAGQSTELKYSRASLLRIELAAFGPRPKSLPGFFVVESAKGIFASGFLVRCANRSRSDHQTQVKRRPVRQLFRRPQRDSNSVRRSCADCRC
jgi:hypothetical protein